MKETQMNRVQKTWDYIAPRGIPTSMMAAKAVFDTAYLLVIAEAARGAVGGFELFTATASIAFIEADIRSHVGKLRKQQNG